MIRVVHSLPGTLAGRLGFAFIVKDIYFGSGLVLNLLAILLHLEP